MKAQIKSTVIQIVVGSIVVIFGLMTLNKYVPAFTLFPKEDLVEQEQTTTETEKISDIKESEPDKIQEQDENDYSDLELEEEATEPMVELPQSTRPNTVFSADKRLKANNLGFVAPREVMRDAKSKITTNFYNEFCERNIPGYQRKIKLYFTLKDEKLANAILFLAAKTTRTTHYFKPQGKDNLLEIPNNFANGRHKIEYGYILKKDINKREIPFYSRSCQITVSDD